MPENRKLSTAKKLVQAAALAAILVPIGSVMVETSTISCGFSGAGGCTPGGSGGGTFAKFDFGPYDLSVNFDKIDRPFRLSVQDSLTDQGTLTGGVDGVGGFAGYSASVNRLAAFPGHTCIPINLPADGINDCVEFVFGNGAGGPPPESGDGWSGGYYLNIHWDLPTGFDRAVDDGTIHILHNTSTSLTGLFDQDMCALSHCTYDPEPGDGVRGGAFLSVLPTSGPAPGAVPEPGSVLLVATGLAALYHRGRRRRTL